MDAFNWIDRRDPAHSLRHAQEDLLTYFDRLPPEVKEALLRADTNTCSWCAQIWTEQYGVEKAVKLIRDVRFIDATHAITPLHGWDSLRDQQKGTKL